MADSQRLPQAAENNLLMSHIARQAHAVNMHAVHVGTTGTGNLLRFLRVALLMLRTHLGNHGSCLQSRAGRGIQLLIMMQLNNLHLRHIPGSLPCHQHHQHGTDSKIRGDEHRGIVLLCQSLQLSLCLIRKAGGADNRGYALFHSQHCIAIHNIRAGKINHYLRLGSFNSLCQVISNNHAAFAHANHLTGICPGYNINCTNQLQLRILHDSLHHCLSHPAAGTANQNLNQSQRLQTTLFSQILDTTI